MGIFSHFQQRLKQRTLAQKEIITDTAVANVTKTVTNIVIDQCGFTGGALMALYACDVKQQNERDPRRQHPRPSRLKDVIQLYFDSYKHMLPSICPLEFLADTLVEFCKLNHSQIQDKEVTSADQAKFNEALNQLQATERKRQEEVI